MSRTVRKIGPVLDLFTAEYPEHGVSDVAAALGVPRSTAHTLLASLVDIGLLRREERGRYRIGWRALELAVALRSTSPVQAAATSVVEDLVEKVGETVQVAVLQRWRALQIDALLGRHPVAVACTPVGDAVDAHCTALGKVLLAHCDPAAVRAHLVAHPPGRYTPASTVDPVGVARELAETRRSGFAVEVEEHEIGVCGTAAPIQDDAGFVVAAIGVAVPADRFAARRNDMVKSVIASAAELSARLVPGRPSSDRGRSAV